MFICDLFTFFSLFPRQIDTMAKLFNFIVNKYRNRNAVGTRKVIGEEEEKQVIVMDSAKCQLTTWL